MPHINNWLLLQWVPIFGLHKIILVLLLLKLTSSAIMLWLGENFTYCVAGFLALNRIYTEGVCKLIDLSISDLADEDFVLNKRRHPIPALIYGAFALLSRVSQSLAPMFGFWVLERFGNSTFRSSSSSSSSSTSSSSLASNIIDETVAKAVSLSARVVNSSVLYSSSSSTTEGGSSPHSNELEEWMMMFQTGGTDSSSGGSRSSSSSSFSDSNDEATAAMVRAVAFRLLVWTPLLAALLQTWAWMQVTLKGKYLSDIKSAVLSLV